MTDAIRFKIIGRPVGKQRARTRRIGNYITHYTPEDTVQWENYVRTIALQYKPVTMHMGGVELSAKFYISKPKSTSKKVELNTKKPDIDNLAKCIMDALNGVYYKDDSQIVCLEVAKRYVPTNEQSYTDVEVVFK